MESELSKIVRRFFMRELAAALPQFEPQAGRGRIAVPGWRSFLWSVADDLHFFIGLGIDPATHSFTIEGAWSDLPEYPPNLLPYVLPELGKDPARKERLTFRVGATSGGGTLMERQWRESYALPEDEIHAHVKEAVQLIQRDFLPRFAQRAERMEIGLVLGPSELSK